MFVAFYRFLTGCRFFDVHGKRAVTFRRAFA